jgi:hypothetical protein
MRSVAATLSTTIRPALIMRVPHCLQKSYTSRVLSLAVFAHLCPHVDTLASQLRLGLPDSVLERLHVACNCWRSFLPLWLGSRQEERLMAYRLRLLLTLSGLILPIPSLYASSLPPHSGRHSVPWVEVLWLVLF